MADNTSCLGCCLNSNWVQPVCVVQTAPFEINWPVFHKESLTVEEQDILRKLGEAWDLFCSLENRSEADNKEFLDSIHRGQQLIALRVARRVNPDIWRQP